MKLDNRRSPDVRMSRSSGGKSAVSSCLAKSSGRIEFGLNSPAATFRASIRSEEHTSELQSLMRISYAVFCLKKKTRETTNKTNCGHERRGRRQNTQKRTLRQS